MTEPRSLDQTAEGWGSVAPSYDRYITHITSMYAEETVARLGVGAGDRVLDVAAGSGAATFAAIARGASVVATDFADEMLERLDLRAREAGVEVDTRVMDGQALDLPDEDYDRAMSVFGFMFFPDQARGASELWRVVRSGGAAAVTTWASPAQNPGFSVFRRAVERVLPDLPPAGPPPVFSLGDPSVLAELLATAGFIDVDVAEVTKTWEFDSPEVFWATLRDGSPVFAPVVDALGADHAASVRDAALEITRTEFGAERVTFPGVALVAVGIRP